MTWFARLPRRKAEALLDYWDDVIAQQPVIPVPPATIPPELGALVRAVHVADAADDQPGFEDRLLADLLARQKAMPHMAAMPITSPLSSPRAPSRARRPWRLRAPQGRYAMPALEIALVILLILASVAGIWLANDRDESPQVASPPTATPTVTAPTDVPMYKANPARTGVMPGPGLDGSPVEVWHINVPGKVAGQPAIVDGVMYFGADNGDLYAVDAASGDTVWTLTGSSAIVTSPVVSDGLVFVGREDGNLYALATANGNTIWSAPGATTPVIADGLLHVSGSDRFLHALDPATGAERWRSSLGAAPSSAPAFADGVVYQATTDAILHAVDAQTGESRWAVQLEGGDLTSTTVSDGVVYQGTKDGVGQNPAYALDAATGEEIWRFGPQTSEGYQSPTIGETLVYFTSNDTNVYALDRASGTLAWKFATTGQIWASPALVGDTPYVSGRDQTLSALDATTGAERWRHAVDGPIPAIPVITGGVAYFGTDFGVMYAIGGSGTYNVQAPGSGSTPESSPVASPAATPVAGTEPTLTLLWESRGGPTPFSKSATVAFAPDGTVWVSDGEHSQFQLFTPDGAWLEAWGGAGQGAGDGQFNFARAASEGDAFGAVAFAPDGSFYVADTGNRRIQHFSADRTFLNGWGGFGAEDGQFISPIDLAVDVDGMVYVSDDNRRDLQVFTPDGAFVRKFGGNGQSEFTGWLALAPDGTLWGIGGSGETNAVEVLHQWTGEGELLQTVREYVGGVAFDPAGNMFIADGEHGRLVLLDPAGALLAEWDLTDPDNQIMGGFPHFDADGNLYMVSYEGILYKYQIAGTPEATPEG